MPENPVTPPLSPAAAPGAETTRYATVGGVRWDSVLEFTHLFRGFRLASNPVKLIVALLAIFVVYAAGRTLDIAWGPQVVPNEIERYQTSTAEDFRQYRRNMEATGRQTLDRLLDETRPAGAAPALLGTSPRAAYSQIKAQAIAQFHERIGTIHILRLQDEQTRASSKAAGMKIDYDSEPAEHEQQERRAAARALAQLREESRDAAGRGIFDTLMKYEIKQFDALLDNTLSFVRVTPVQTAQRTADLEGISTISGGLVSKNPDRLFRSDTVVGCIANMVITGPRWLFTAAGPMQYRPENADTWGGWCKLVGVRVVYLLSLLAWVVVFLAAVAFSGSVICRLSALEFAGVERPVVKDVLTFAWRKLWTFVTAPLTPFAILLVVGLAMTAGGFIGAIPYVGEIVMGLAFVAFLVGGFILMLVLLGVLGGFNLIYPTIATEGSDTFDAMSRAFAYVYARPWRLAFYTVVVLIYGAATILFVGFAIYVLLAMTHVFVGWGASLFGNNYGAYSGQPKLDTLWPMPQFNRLAEPIGWWSMSWSEMIGAIGLHFWVFGLIAMLGAYVVSYYHSSHTIMYFLLRRSVEGQSLSEVYQEEVAPPAAEAPKSVPAEAAPPPTDNPVKPQ